jgi:hypothetical protein
VFLHFVFLIGSGDNSPSALGESSPASAGFEMIKQQIENLRSNDPRFRLFGSGSHRYRLVPPLPSAHVADIESAFQITLPPEYRDFITTVANGGAGPGYGLERFIYLASKEAKPKPAQRLFRIIDVDGWEIKQPYPCDEAGNELDRFDFHLFDSAASYAPDGDLGAACLTRPFPLTAPFRAITDDMWEAYIPNWNAQIRDRHKANKEELSRVSPSDGAMRIAHYGSRIYALIVLNGPFRGQIWIHDPNLGDYVPASMRTDLHDQTIKVEDAYRLQRKPPLFDEWYQHWLDASSAQTQREYSKDQRAGDEQAARKTRPIGSGPLVASGEEDGISWQLFGPPPS